MNETQATTKLIKQLNDYGYFWKASDRFRAGIPDIIGVYRGRFVAIEVKVDYNKPTPLQVHTIAEMMENGGFCAVVTYNNRSKNWWVGGAYGKLQSFATPRHVALHIIEKVAKHEVQDKTIPTSD